MRLTELSEQVGITVANLSNLKTGKARAIRFTTRTLPHDETPQIRDGVPLLWTATGSLR